MQEFLTALMDFITQVESMSKFKGQTQAIRALRRIYHLSVFETGRPAERR